VAVRQAVLVSDESALEACLRRCAIQIDDLYLLPLPLPIPAEWKAELTLVLDRDGCPHTVNHPSSSHLIVFRPGIEPTTSRSQVKHPTVTP